MASSLAGVGGAAAAAAGAALPPGGWSPRLCGYGCVVESGKGTGVLASTRGKFDSKHRGYVLCKSSQIDHSRFVPGKED